MRIFREIENLPDFRRPTLTMGTFDGVHLGHQEIINTLKKEATEIDGETVLLTFWPHPRLVLRPDDNSLKLLNTIDEKIAILEKTGLDNLVIVPFTESLSKMSHMDFIKEILVDVFHVKALVIGHDHQFGKNREGNFEQLEECAPVFSFSLTQVPELKMDNIAISSSKIRHALQEAETEKANTLLGYSYSVTGTVVEGKKRGRELGFPTANIHIDEPYKLMPADGVYVVEANIDGDIHKGMASIGYNPTFGDTGKTLEVNIFDFNSQIYNKKITILFLHYIRKEIKFANLDELVRQISADGKEAKKYFINLKTTTF